jgi:hypothetical protein
MPRKSQPASRSELQSSGRSVYDKANGEVVHFHKVMWRSEHQPPTAAVVDADARRVASKVVGRAEHSLEVVATEPDQLKRDVAYVVDLQTKKIVERPQR